jgi:hypothetical protein
MNKEFIKNLIKAEKYKYEAIKEILPSNLRCKLDEFEKDALSILKDVAFEIIKEGSEVKTSKKSTKKVEVDFS